MEKEEILKKILNYFSYFKNQVETYNGSHLYDINTISEDFVKDLINFVYGYKLTNTNIIDNEFPAIDLGDINTRIAIQVTSNANSKKIKKTLVKFKSHDLSKDYDTLFIYSILKKQKRYRCSETLENFTPENNIKDFNDLGREISHLSTEKCKEICSFIEKELRIIKTDSSKTDANEIETIIDLIEFLSSNKEKTVFIDETNVDPAGKIYKRFSDYKDVLLDQIRDFNPIYRKALEEAKDKIGLDSTKINWIRRHLKNQSDRYLRECSNNPLSALDILCDFYEKKLSTNGKNYDLSAIRFFMLKELVNCNVFPNHSKLE